MRRSKAAPQAATPGRNAGRQRILLLANGRKRRFVWRDEYAPNGDDRDKLHRGGK